MTSPEAAMSPTTIGKLETHLQEMREKTGGGDGRGRDRQNEAGRDD